MSYEDLIARIEGALPDLAGKITVDRVIYKRTDRHAYFYLFSEIAAGEKEYMTIRKILNTSFPGLQMSLRIASPALREDFLSQPDKYGHILNNILSRQHPSVRAWEYDMRYRSEEGRIVLELPDEFALQYLKEHALVEKIETAVKDIFCLETTVVCRVAGSREETIRRLERERRAEEARALQRREDARRHEEELQKRRDTEKEKRDRVIRGRQIREKPVNIASLNGDSGDVVIAGRRLDYEEKELSGGEMLLVSFHLTDYTGTILCKMFLRYRPRARRDETQDLPPVTDEQRSAVLETARRLKNCEGVMVQNAALIPMRMSALFWSEAVCAMIYREEWTTRSGSGLNCICIRR